MGGLREIVRVATQGNAAFPWWVTTYDLKCSRDGFTWFSIKDHVTGNTDPNTVVEYTLTRPVKCRAVRFYPKTWNNFPAMRVDVITRRPPESRPSSVL